ncbi:MAG: hypothetical protein ACLTMP_02270 [Eggerthella lenta]
MKPFILLLKIQLLGLFGINKTLHADPAKAKRTLALAALVVAAVVLFASAHSAGVARGSSKSAWPKPFPWSRCSWARSPARLRRSSKRTACCSASGLRPGDVASRAHVVGGVVAYRIAVRHGLLFGVLVMVPAFAVRVGCWGVGGRGRVRGAVHRAGAASALAAAVVLAVLIAAVSSRFKHANVAVIVLTLAATLAAVFAFRAVANPTTWRR